MGQSLLLILLVRISPIKVRSRFYQNLNFSFLGQLFQYYLLGLNACQLGFASYNKVWNDVRVCVRVWVSFNKVAKSPWSLNLSWPLQVNWVLDLLVGYKICWYLVFLASQLGFGFASWFWDLLIFGVGFETPWP